MSSAVIVAWNSAAFARSAASKGGGPRRSSCACIAASSGALPTMSDTALTTRVATRVSVISAAPSATLRTRATSGVSSSSVRARIR